MPNNKHELYPSIEPYDSGMLAVDDTHTIYWEQSGNPNGVPVVFLHGGPGAGSSPEHRRFFDPTFYRIIIFDQRGAGRSKPIAEMKNNTPKHLIADIETLRKKFNIDKWLVFGGSWGSTLAIAYGEAHPESCLGFILRGIFLMRDKELEWFLGGGVKTVYPEVWEKYVNFIPVAERDNLLEAYRRRLNNPDPAIHMPAAKAFSRFEAEISTLLPSEKLVQSYLDDVHALGMARIEVDYCSQKFPELGEALLSNLHQIKHLPAIIVQGRYDMCCPAISAYELAQAWPESELVMVPDSGHSAFEPNTARELVGAMERFKEKT